MSRLPGGGSTLSRYWNQFPSNVPRNLVRAERVTVWDADGKAYLDWTSSLCANLLGYGAVTDAVIRHLIENGGPSWPLTHPLEEQVADTLCRMAGYEANGQVRFVKTGSAACSAAIRIARAVTGRELIVSTGYHGWHDQFVAATPPAWGVPEGVQRLILDVPYGDLEAVQRVAWGLEPDTGKEFPRGGTIPKVAAIIVEPVILDAPPEGYLQGLRDVADKEGAVLIFDETITGGRFTEFTAGQQYGVQPDLLILGKGIANGWPLACVLGNEPVMRCLAPDWAGDKSGQLGPVFVSGTFGPETSALAAAEATLREWSVVVANHIQSTTLHIKHDLLVPIAEQGQSNAISLEGSLSRLILRIPDPVARTLVVQEMVKQGVLLGPGFNPSLAHTKTDVDQTVEAFDRALTILSRAQANDQFEPNSAHAVIEGEVIQPAYRSVALAPGYGEDSGIEGDTDHHG